MSEYEKNDSFDQFRQQAHKALDRLFDRIRQEKRTSKSYLAIDTRFGGVRSVKVGVMKDDEE